MSSKLLDRNMKRKPNSQDVCLSSYLLWVFSLYCLFFFIFTVTKTNNIKLITSSSPERKIRREDRNLLLFLLRNIKHCIER